MSLQRQVSAERLHIGFFGLRNAGKSSVVNAVTGQQLSVVSPVKGTTTDPVQKAMELLPLGPVVILDTPGIDDEGDLGQLRVSRARQALDKTDIAVLVVDGRKGLSPQDQELLAQFDQKDIPHITVYNKADLLSQPPTPQPGEIYVSATQGTHIPELKQMLGQLGKDKAVSPPLVSDLLSPGDTVVLVTPIDAAAPKGRLILPQQQVLRDILDAAAMGLVVQPEQLSAALKGLMTPPKLVITDSQAFGQVNRDTPADILLTSFSILFARYKGDLAQMVEGAAQLDHLQEGDRVLICEGCTHHRQCGDIGTDKLPRWLQSYTGKGLEYAFTSGGDFPQDLSSYQLVIHCGGCMLTPRQMRHRLQLCQTQKVPVTNYGTAIAQLHHILARSLSPFPALAEKVKK